jgi:hypothetical protein
MNNDISELAVQIVPLVYWHAPPKDDAEKATRAQIEIRIRRKAARLERGVAAILKELCTGPTGEKR